MPLRETLPISSFSWEERIIVALDVASRTEALRLITLLPQAKFFKVGLRLFVAEGPEFVEEIIKRGKEVFLDLKLHDIPNTVGQTVEEIVNLGVRMMTLHVAGGRMMMKRAVEAVQNLNASKKKYPPLLLGVTVLTSLTPPDLQEIGVALELSQQVVRLARLAEECGLDGLICSPQEVEEVRRIVNPEMILITPGIRPSWSTKNDQRRVTTPREAFQKGADFIVVGRPIIASSRPHEAFSRIVEEIKDLT
ncbi:MAG TPA: orotidine-5'-phosphate decarboxylase [Candidatus Aminicenantes bacterium]|nr:orotidine-5'-phosphate decarboxylase [Candidatus Aminicenantes bacterium]HHF42987.1 orotidine-5'-phosphate decarboxylase [Candidatus Aminicenantes bacterium]